MYVLCAFSICLGESFIKIQCMFFLSFKVSQRPLLKCKVAPFSMESCYCCCHGEHKVLLNLNQHM